MKKRLTSFVILFQLLCLLSGCSSLNFTNKEPDILQIRNIVNLATLECYYHNVAKGEKSKGTGITAIGEKDRKFWIEYTGIVTLGVDMSKVTMEINDTDITITLPPAKVLGLTIDDDSWNPDSYISSQDGINQNKITAEDVTAAILVAQKTMKETAESNATMLNNAQIRARTLIENYINQLGAIAGIEYKINWKYLD